MLKPGDTIDRYVIVRLLGTGGMGQVYEARDGRLQRGVALKVVRLDAAEKTPGAPPSSGADGARLLREARLAAALEHPNVVAIYDVGEVDQPAALKGTMYLAMELIAGSSLRTYVGDATVPMATRVRWLTDVARALGAAHGRGLVHRDVKPENVMIREDGVVKVLDFGIAKRTGAMIEAGPTGGVATMTAKGMTVGTPYYMAPEQMRGEPLDGRADQFAWGVLAYELLSGDLPWSTGGDNVQLIAEVLTRDPPLLTTVVDKIPLAAAATVMRALAKSPEHRFDRMEDVVASLGGAVALEAVPSTKRPREGPEIGLASTELTAATGEPHATLGAVPAARKPQAPRPSRALFPFALTLGVAVIGTLVASRWFASARPGAGSAAPSAVASPRECETSAQCAATHPGAPVTCRKSTGTCVLLESQDCKVLARPGDLQSDDTVWLGSMFPLGGESGKEYGQSNANAVELARRDFADAMASVISQPKSGARPIALISCDDSVQPARAAKHLAEEVGVPAVIGFASSAEVIDLAESVFLPRGVMSVVALNTSPIITTLPHPAGGPRLVWRTTYSTVAAVPAIDSLVEKKLEPEARKAASIAPAGRVRVALLREDSAAFLAFSDALFRGLRFNGQSALDDGADFREFVCDEACASGDGPARRAIVQAASDFAPHVIVVAGTPRLVDAAIVPLEATWRARDHRPTYVEMTVPPQEVLRWIGASEAKRRRFFAVTSVSTTLPNARFVMHYNATFPQPITRTISPNTSYDAFYLLAFASYAVGEAEITGASLARGIARLVPPGRPVEVGPSGIYEAYDTLHAGGSLDVTGATGRLDFDPQTGEAPADMSILCVDVDAQGAAFDMLESGLVYHSAAASLDGTMRCP